MKPTWFNLGFYLTFSYQGNDVSQNNWKYPAQVTLYNANASSAPLGQLTYGSDGSITDLLGRVYNCPGCGGAVGASVEGPAGSRTLPGEPILWDEGSSMNCSGTKFLHTDHEGSIIAVADCWGTRPQMFAGVTYSFFVANAVIATELFLVFRSLWALVAAVVIHLVGVVLCAREPRIFDLWLVRVGRCPRVRNHAIWRCNSYRA